MALKAAARVVHAEASGALLENVGRGWAIFCARSIGSSATATPPRRLPYLLDSLATRGDDQRALVRYLVGALVLLEAIGTFYGLLLTIAGVRDVIGGLPR